MTEEQIKQAVAEGAHLRGLIDGYRAARQEVSLHDILMDLGWKRVEDGR